MSVYSVTLCYFLALSYKRTLLKHLFYKLNSASYHSRCFRVYFSNSMVNRVFFKESAYLFPISVTIIALAVSILYLILPTHHQLSRLFEILALWDIWNMKKETLTAKIVSLILLSSLVPFLWTERPGTIQHPLSGHKDISARAQSCFQRV